VRVAEDGEDRAAAFRALSRQFQNLEQFVDSLEARLRQAESREDAAGAADALQDECRRLASDLTLLNQRYAAFLETMTQLKGELRAEIEGSLVPLVKPLKDVEARLAAMEADWIDPQELGRLAIRLQALEEAGDAAAIPPGSPLVEDTASVTTPPVPAKPRREKGPEIERPQREPRVRHRPEEPRLLHRAIKENQDSASSAVARIIESRGPTRADAETAEPAAEAGSAADSVPPLEEVVDLSAEQHGAGDGGLEAPEVLDEAPIGEVEAPEIADAETEFAGAPADEASALDSETAGEPEEPRADTPADSSDAPAEEASPAQPGLLFEEDPAPPAPKKVRIKKDDTVLTASIFIGIGNKPFLRGSGAGLSWERGQPMEFQEIGKWRWVAPTDIDEPIELQVFRNDEDADRSGRFQLRPGEKLDISPVF
jgi:hypothetical protein